MDTHTQAHIHPAHTLKNKPNLTANTHISSPQRQNGLTLHKENISVQHVGRKHANYFYTFVCFWTMVHISFELMSSQVLILSEGLRLVAAVVARNEVEQK